MLSAGLAGEPAPAGDSAVSFVVVGDFGTGEETSQWVADMVLGWEPDFIVTTGDNIGTADVTVGSAAWKQHVGDLYGSYILGTTDDRHPEQTSGEQRFFPTVGNHDSDGTWGEIPGYLDYFHDDPAGDRLPSGVHEAGASYYDFEIAGIHFFAVDSEHAVDQGDDAWLLAQQAWLRDGLAASTADFNFVYFHHPPYSSFPLDTDSVVMRWPFAEWGADAVFGGHRHFYERLLVDDLPYIISGLGGRPIYPTIGVLPESIVRYTEAYGALLVTVDAGLATMEFLSIDDGALGANGGKLIDTFYLDKSAGPQVVTREVFYNNSAFDGNDPAADARDDAAVAIDKTALCPGQSATPKNVVSYDRGINGVIVDVAGAARPPVADDFSVKVGNDDDPADWADGPAPDVAVRPGEGVAGSDRVTLTWPDRAITNQWLEVTVHSAGLALDADDVFYFGNAVADAGNSPTDLQVTATDLLLARNNPRTFLNPAAIDLPYDYNRDGRVDATDVLLARNNPTNFLTALRLIDLSVSVGG